MGIQGNFAIQAAALWARGEIPEDRMRAAIFGDPQVNVECSGTPGTPTGPPLRGGSPNHRLSGHAAACLAGEPEGYLEACEYHEADAATYEERWGSKFPEPGPGVPAYWRAGPHGHQGRDFGSPLYVPYQKNGHACVAVAPENDRLRTIVPPEATQHARRAIRRSTGFALLGSTWTRPSVAPIQRNLVNLEPTDNPFTDWPVAPGRGVWCNAPGQRGFFAGGGGGWRTVNPLGVILRRVLDQPDRTLPARGELFDWRSDPQQAFAGWIEALTGRGFEDPTPAEWYGFSGEAQRIDSSRALLTNFREGWRAVVDLSADAYLTEGLEYHAMFWPDGARLVWISIDLMGTKPAALILVILPDGTQVILSPVVYRSNKHETRATVTEEDWGLVAEGPVSRVKFNVPWPSELDPHLRLFASDQEPLRAVFEDEQPPLPVPIATRRECRVRTREILYEIHRSMKLLEEVARSEQAPPVSRDAWDWAQAERHGELNALIDRARGAAD